jgi:hypothetical protein
MRAFDPSRLIETLTKHQVEYVVIGGMAGALHGASAATYLLEVCYRATDKNVARLTGALAAMNARLRGVENDSSAQLNEESFRSGNTVMTITDFGDLDCVERPLGSAGYDELFEQSREMELGPDTPFQVCSVEHLITMNRSAHRPQDLIAADALEHIKRIAERSH